MKRLLLMAWLVLLTGTCSAKTECDMLRESGLRLLPHTTFDVHYREPLDGCFSGYLPEGSEVLTGLYHFGVFQEGKQVALLPIVAAGMDLASRLSNQLRIVAVSFDDLDHDGQRDVMVIGQNLIAHGDRTFVQIYWGCGLDFDYDDKTNSEVNWANVNKPVINVQTVKRIIALKKLKSGCERAKR